MIPNEPVVLIPCDGCDGPGVAPAEITFVQALGHIMRYCSDCKDLYFDLKKNNDIAAERAQRQLDFEVSLIRKRCRLKLTPLDLPKLMTDAQGKVITLG